MHSTLADTSNFNYNKYSTCITLGSLKSEKKNQSQRGGVCGYEVVVLQHDATITVLHDASGTALDPPACFCKVSMLAL